MQYILSHKHRLITFVTSVVLSVLFVVLYVSGASLMDTNSVGVGTTTVGAGLYVEEGFVSLLSGDAYVYGQLNVPYIVSTSTTASTFAGQVITSGTAGMGVGTATPGASQFGVNEGWTSVLSGDAYVYGQLNVPYIVSTSTTASTFAGQVITSGTAGMGVGTATPGASQFGVNEGWTSVLSGDAYIYGQLSLRHVVSTSTAASSFAGSVGVGTTTPGTDPIGLYVSEYANIGGPLELEDYLYTSYVVGTSTAIASSFAGSVGVGTTTPGTDPIGLYVAEYANIGGPLELEDYLYTSYIVATSTTATSTVGFGVTVDSTTLVVDAGGNRVGIATTTWPTVLTNADAATSADLEVDVSIGAGSATTTMFIAGGGTVGAQLILKDSDGQGCTMITVLDGSISTGDISCPKP